MSDSPQERMSVGEAWSAYDSNEWVSAKNEVVQSGEICLTCYGEGRFVVRPSQ